MQFQKYFCDMKSYAERKKTRFAPDGANRVIFYFLFFSSQPPHIPQLEQSPEHPPDFDRLRAERTARATRTAIAAISR